LDISNHVIKQIQPGEDKSFWVGTSLVTCKAESVIIHGYYSLLELIDQPQNGPPMHVHHRDDEAYYILEGQYEIYRANEPPTKAAPGSFIYFPKGVAHTYKNVGKGPGRMLVVNTRAGLERFVEEVGQSATDTSSPPIHAGTPDFGKMIEIAQKYDIEIIGSAPRN
jgi:mannose-6-phosphate isomerase-like protein (cupin superfamily)